MQTSGGTVPWRGGAGPVPAGRRQKQERKQGGTRLCSRAFPCPCSPGCTCSRDVTSLCPSRPRCSLTSGCDGRDRPAGRCCAFTGSGGAARPPEPGLLPLLLLLLLLPVPVLLIPPLLQTLILLLPLLRLLPLLLLGLLLSLLPLQLRRAAAVHRPEQPAPSYPAWPQPRECGKSSRGHRSEAERGHQGITSQARWGFAMQAAFPGFFSALLPPCCWI